jgi:CRISPR-associated protein Cas5d
MTHRRFRIFAEGPFACFTRPEFKVERVSYDVITPSAARALFDSVFWHPGVRWVVREIAVVRPGRSMMVRRNEVTQGASTAAVKRWMQGQPIEPLVADEQRSQRGTLLLRDVAYALTADLTTLPSESPATRLKYATMFERRLAKGQQFTVPAFGCRECVADLRPATDEDVPVATTQSFGRMLYDVVHGDEARPLFYDAHMQQGRIAVPDLWPTERT